ncbi:MAG: transglutaminase domain-containing protein [Acidobacteriota bacterium]|nr:transglutaminase domain-containing protein [Acidobacteriota bacterium]
MKRGMLFTVTGLLLGSALFAFPSALCFGKYSGPTETRWFALERHGRLMGYTIETTYGGNEEAAFPERIDRETRLFVRLMGRDIDVRIDERLTLATDTGRPHRYRLDYNNGNFTRHLEVRIDGSKIHITRDSRQPVTHDLEEDIYLDGSPRFERVLIAAFADDGARAEQTIRIVDSTTGRIVRRTYARLGEETLDLDGVPRRCVLVGTYDPINRFYTRLWLAPEEGRIIKAELPRFTTRVPADARIAERIERLDMDDTVIVPTNVAVADYERLDFMRVKARIRSQDPRLSVENLNVPGQRFEGTIRDGVIEGVFEIAHRRYKGAAAPPFPPDFDADETPARFLRPGFMVEADDPAIVARAKALTAGATDSWDAAVRISRWVAENIGYGLPDGSAARTLEIRKGGCAAHSFLFAAMCRAVGIPARMVGGYMLTPNMGGSFVHHGWNEVYMGRDAGWITLDTTAGEVDYVDSGHLRLAREATFIAESIEVLDYRAGNLRMGEEPALIRRGKPPWPFGSRRHYRFFLRGREVGTAVFTISRGEGGRRLVDSEVALGAGNSYTGHWVLDEGFRAVSFTAEGTRAGRPFDLKGLFSKKGLKVSGNLAGKRLDRSIPAAAGALPLEVLQPGFYALLAGVLPETSSRVPLRAYLPATATLLAISAHLPPAAPNSPPGAVRVLDLNLGTPVKAWLEQDGTLNRLTFVREGLVAEPVRRERNH